MDHIPRLSEVLYVGLCHEIGTPTEVAIRRDVLDMEGMIKKPIHMYRGFVWMFSGSYREGFRFGSSDRDTMCWTYNHKLITDISQCWVYNPSKHDIILMEDSGTPPGFVRLCLLTSPRDDFTISSLVPFNGGAYISSSLWRETYFQSLANDRRNPNRNITIHGPCTNSFYESIEIDQAVCFATKCWPNLIRGWVDRCQRHIWPSMPVLETILSKGCHCVPIGSKISPFNQLEWRLSFSQAEQQLVCAMNHTQFLCYGLLKIFLKEVINYRKEPLLCSYYMKTTTFWIIQLGHVIWCPNNLLDCFWICFKYLIHCVYRGVFPNFFIAQNNMFINKVVGIGRESLLQQLYQYYRMGVSCLLLSPTLRSILEPALSSPSFVLSSAEGEFIDNTDVDMSAMLEIFQESFPAENISVFYLYLKSFSTLSWISLSSYQSLTLQFCTAQTLVQLAFTIANSTPCYTYKNFYVLDRIICNMLKLALRLGPVSYLLYLALYYYRTGRYEKTLHITYLTKQRLSQDFNMYVTVDRQRYNETVGSLSLSRRMTRAWMINVRLLENILCIEELCLEQKASQQNGEPMLHLSPFLVVEMLSVLTHYRQGSRSQCLQSLTDLQTLVLYDDGTYVPLKTRDISWQVLGICQHVVGDLHGALHSYQESLRQKPVNKIQEATCFRIGCVKQQLQRNDYM
ncbi:uncharacterized protein LOC133188272 [Saccostrea echinata]|uniref:uncharacterized protein LOC133188272 n=1 Tax=Saccostrea echinata TaxID=191078 RepID=UPI002A7F8138|nr:uncharacterized protein LOC133188272 [Saccostrea echinata]